MAIAPTTPYQPYAALHKTIKGPGDARPTAEQVILDRFPPPTTSTGLKGRVILITGASSGIGVETARALYSAGATLYLGARDLKKLQAVIDDIVSSHKKSDNDASGTYTPPVPEKLELHLDSLPQIRSAAAEFLQRSNSTLHVLINNAGVMACPLTRTKDGLEQQIGTNHFGHFQLYTLLEGALLSGAESSGQLSRVVNLSSMGHRMGSVRLPDWNFTANSTKASDGKETNSDYHKWASYGQSKTANIWMASAIHRRHGTGGKPLLTGFSVHPGGIKTELGRHLDDVEDAALLKDSGYLDELKSIPQGAATSVWAAVAEHFDDPRNGGRYLEDVGESGAAPPGAEGMTPGYAAWAYDEAGAEELWRISVETVKEK